ncbi:NAD(P)-binding domain-containing protein [Rhodococcus sp. IEGM 1379]|uniref:NAD(P)-binding domain-containing protein n=1 Tax=Rhodococcus sp. IEGM 1379 TaxID=3047086 RepID=UPI0024B71C2E|nr:NAD(P)-binding domain-containing protein [Rhodococcus sp. IEGM 1379]MDI9919113.1 NAD(P)-binding domain-containing protein [Rhodococcus sp. IEGM 1379]
MYSGDQGRSSQAWARAGNELVIAGRSMPRAGLVAKEIGDFVRAVDVDQLAAESDVVVIAVLREGADDALALANAPTGAPVAKAHHLSVVPSMA